MNHYNYYTKWQAPLPPANFRSTRNELLCVFSESQAPLYLQDQGSLFVLRTSILYFIQKPTAALNCDRRSAATICKVLCLKSSSHEQTEIGKGKECAYGYYLCYREQICLILHFFILDLQLKVIQFIEEHFQKAQIKQQMWRLQARERGILLCPAKLLKELLFFLGTGEHFISW